MKHLPTFLLLACAALSGCQGDAPQNDPDAGSIPDAAFVPDGSLPDHDLGAAPDQGALDDAGAPPCVSDQVEAGPQNVAICPLASPTRHVRIEGLMAAPTHGSAQLFLGLAGPVGPQEALAPGQFKLQLYGGGTPAPPPQVGAYFGAESVALPGSHSFVNSPSTLCFDVHPGSESTRALLVLWLDGHAGADCVEPATLTFESRYGHAWAPSVGALDTASGIYFYQSSGTQTPRVTLEDAPALAYDAVPPPECTSGPMSTSASQRYVELCALDAPPRHVRLRDVVAADPHGAVSLLVGYPAPADPSVGPSAPTTSAQLRVQLYGGFQPHSDARVDVHYEATSTLLDGDHAFLATPSTLCFDLHDGSATTPPYLVLWRDGVGGADCDDFATLTSETAFASVLDYGGVVGALDKSLPLYLYQNTGGSTASVTLSTRSALDL